MTRTRFHEVALVAALATLGFSAATIAQTSGGAASQQQSGTAPKAGSLAGADRTFAMKAAQGGIAEVEAGKLAQSKAQNDSVKQFAQRMVTDHSKANDELMSLARSKNTDLPSALDRNHKAHVDKLDRLSGPDFDRQYMKHMVDDHKKTVAEFEKQAKSGKDEDLRKWADSKLPTLREHLKMAQSTHDQVAKGGGNPGGHKGHGDAKSASDSKTGGKSDPSKPVNSANPAGNTTGSNTGNTAGAAPKPQTTGK